MLQEKFFFISAVCSVLAARLCLLADDFERDRSSMSPPPWLVMAAIKDVVTLLDRFRRSAAGPIFFRMSLSMVTVVPVERGVQILFGVYSSSVSRERFGEESDCGSGSVVGVFGLLREEEEEENF